MLATAKFQRISSDLEKLPCELHGDILDDLEFAQLIRLSSCAGPRLTWSLENSLSAWGDYFRAEDRSTWQKLLSILDSVRYLCFVQPKSKEDLPYIFSYFSLAFLSYRNQDWKAIIRSRAPGESEAHGRFVEHQFARNWFVELNSIVMVTTWSAFHEHYARLIEPTLPQLPPQAKTVFSKIPELGCKDAVWYSYSRLSQNPPFSIDDLVTFIDMYQQFRLLRAETLASELYRLADIYEAHPTRLKEPFDLRVRAPHPLNTQHVPTHMRRQARKMIRKAKNGKWKCSEGSIVRFAWPALVPYESEVELFYQGLANAADIQVAPAEIVDKCRAVITNAPSWAQDSTEGEVNAVTHLSESLEQQHVSLYGPNPDVRVRAYQAEQSRRAPVVLPVLPRGDAELEWLENFAEVTAWMRGKLPDNLQDGH